MTVTINIHGESAADALRELKGLSVGLLAFQGAREAVASLTTQGQERNAEPGTATEVAELDKNETRPIPTTVIPRERGKAAPGRARRTKEEIAEDEAADAADAAAASTTLGISSGGERVDPADTADERAEDEASREPEKPLTVDDVKAAVGEYVTKFDMNAAQEDGPGLFIDVLGAPPAGENFWRMSILPNDQAKFAAVVAAWKAAAKADQRYKRKGA